VRSIFVGAGLIFALSPALLEWANHIAAVPATAYALVFPLLLLIACRSVPTTRPSTLEGMIWIAAAVGVELVTFAGGVERAGRVAIPMGIIGFLRLIGAAPLASASLAFFVVPVPSAIASLAPLDEVWKAFAEFVVGPSGGTLPVDGWDSGARIVALFAGLGWYAEAKVGGTWAKSVQRGAQLAMLGLPVQLGAMIVAVAIARAGAPEVARAFLTHGLWMACMLVSIWFMEKRTVGEELSSDV
jgi:hypothetical protein